MTCKDKFMSCDLRCVAAIMLTLVVIYISSVKHEILTEGLLFYIFTVIVVLLVPSNTVTSVTDLMRKRAGRR